MTDPTDAKVRRSDAERAERFVRRNQHGDCHAALVQQAAGLAAAAGRDLQASFDGGVAALIVGCNQFVRFRRDGAVELLLPEAAEAALAVPVSDPEGAVFRMFGWVAVPGDADLTDALSAAWDRAITP